MKTYRYTVDQNDDDFFDISLSQEYDFSDQHDRERLTKKCAKDFYNNRVGVEEGHTLT